MKEKMFTDITIIWKPAAVDVNMSIIMTNMTMSTNTRNPAAVDANMGTHITMTSMTINTSQRNLAAVDANMVIHIIMTNMTMWGMIMGTGNPIIRKGIRLAVSVNCVILTRDAVISVVRALQTASAICLTLTVKRKFIS